MQKKKLALAVVLALLVVGVALGVHLTHKNAYADTLYYVYIHSGNSPVTGLHVTFTWFRDGDPVDEDANPDELQPGWYIGRTTQFPNEDFDAWNAGFSDQGIITVSPDSNPIPDLDPDITIFSWSVASDMR